MIRRVRRAGPGVPGPRRTRPGVLQSARPASASCSSRHPIRLTAAWRCDTPP